MMEKKNRLNALMVEILLAVLFFALSATVILDCFATARRLSARAEAEGQALLAAQNLAEALYTGEKPDALLAEQGLLYRDGLWRQEGDGWNLTVALEQEHSTVGVLRAAEVRVFVEGEFVAALPCSRYMPEEVAR